MKLLQWGKAGRAVYFVDAFAGEGRDKAGNPGSPLIATQIALQTQTHLRATIPDARMHVIAIEKGTARVKALRDHIEQFEQSTPGLVTVLHGELKDHIDDIVAETAAAPTLYFIDPFGIQGLDASTYAKMLAGAYNEMFVLFADIGAVRLHGVVSARGPNVEEQLHKLRTTPSLFPELDAEAEATVRARAEEHVEALDLTRPACRDYLHRALGGSDWEAKLDRIAPRLRSDAFLELFLDALLKAGAEHVLAVPMRAADGPRVYALVYASKSLKGLVTMKECVSFGLRSNNLPTEVSDRIRAELRSPVLLTVQTLEHNFPGRTIRWRDDASGAESVRRFVLEDTPMFDFQLEELQGALIDAGYIDLGKSGNPKKPIFVRFPPTPPL